MENNLPLTAATEESREVSPPASWQRSDGALLLAALLAAGCYFFAHFPYSFLNIGHLPGIGLAATQWLMVLTVCAIRRKSLRMKGNKSGIFLLVIALGLGACCAIFANDAIRLMNLPVLWLSTYFALFSLSGAQPFSCLSANGIRFCLRRFIPSFFIHWPLPFRALKRVLGGQSREKAVHVAFGFALGLPAVLIALWLLSSADHFFGGLMQSGFHVLDFADGEAAIRTVFTLLGGLCLFSLLRSTQCRPAALPDAKERGVAPEILVTPLTMLSAVYAVFTYIQCRYLLFGSAEAVRTAGYAEYARSGFFQLVALAFLTLLLILPCLSLGKNSKAVRTLCGVTAMLTVVIDYSAFYRMRLYIEAYGLSILRLITLWGMLMILLSLGACLFKCLMPRARICPLLTAAALSSWLLLNLANPDRIVAKYQVDAYNMGTLSSLDTDYLASLSPDVLSELERIEDPKDREQALSRVQNALSCNYPVPYDWAFCWLRVPEKTPEEALTLSVSLDTREPVYALSADFLWNGETRLSQSCVNARSSLPLDGRVDFTLSKADIPDGLDFASDSFAVQFFVQTAPEAVGSSLLPVSAPLSLSPAREENFAFTLSGDSASGFSLVPQSP